MTRQIVVATPGLPPCRSKPPHATSWQWQMRFLEAAFPATALSALWRMGGLMGRSLTPALAFRSQRSLLFAPLPPAGKALPVGGMADVRLTLQTA